MNGRAKIHYFLQLYRKSEIFETVFQNMMRASISARLCRNKGEMQSQVRHPRFASARSQRPAPAGRWESRRKKRKLRTVKSHSKAPIRQLFFSWKQVIAFCWWEEAEGRGLLGSLFHRSFERHNDVPLKCFFGEFFQKFLVTSPAHSLAE